MSIQGFPSNDPKRFNQNPQPRLNTNTEALEELETENKNVLARSFAFTTGDQQPNSHYDALFLDLFRHMRGPSPLIEGASSYLSSRLSYHDISQEEETFICPLSDTPYSEKNPSLKKSSKKAF